MWCSSRGSCVVLSCKSASLQAEIEETYQFQDSYFHLTLIEIRWFVLDNLDGKQLVRSHILTLDDLSKCTLTQYIKNEIPVSQLWPYSTESSSSPITSLLTAQNIIDVEDIIVILIIGTIVVNRFTRLGKDSTRIIGSLVAELRVAQRVRLCEVRCQTLERLRYQLPPVQSSLH